MTTDPRSARKAHPALSQSGPRAEQGGRMTRTADIDAPMCEVHIPGRDRPSPWCAACRMSGARATPPGEHVHAETHDEYGSLLPSVTSPEVSAR